MTRDDFIVWLQVNHPAILLRPSAYDLVPCYCGDVNCRGWRVVERARAPAPELTYEPVVETP